MTESKVYLRKVAINQLVEASLFDEITDEHLLIWKTTWVPAMEAYCKGRADAEKPDDSQWNWKWKADKWRPFLKYHSFSIVCEKELQGLMLASDLKSARIQAQFGKPIVYVELLASAPWNRSKIQKPKRFGGVGTIMLAAAIQLSLDLGFKGRIGLHSLPGAESFYQDDCGMTPLGNDAAYGNWIYFEMTEKQADEFRQK
jgi:hypothetical protein